jgi:hypothetical protein
MSSVETATGCLQNLAFAFKKGRFAMGEKNSKKDKNKAQKQKQAMVEKKKEEQKNKLPSKKPA